MTYSSIIGWDQLSRDEQNQVKLEASITDWSQMARDAGFKRYFHNADGVTRTYHRFNIRDLDRDVLTIRLGVDGRLLLATLNGDQFGRPQPLTLRRYLYDEANRLYLARRASLTEGSIR